MQPLIEQVCVVVSVMNVLCLWLAAALASSQPVLTPRIKEASAQICSNILAVFSVRIAPPSPWLVTLHAVPAGEPARLLSLVEKEAVG
jgi:hypothetical protein